MQERQEREFPLRKGSLIRTEEGILFSRSTPTMIPILSAPEVEIDDVLDVYGDSLDEAVRMAALVKAEKFISNLLEFHGQGLSVMNWHQNGDGEPWDNFIDGVMEGDELESIRAALSSSITEDTRSERRECTVCKGTGVDTFDWTECRPCDGIGSLAEDTGIQKVNAGYLELRERYAHLQKFLSDGVFAGRPIKNWEASNVRIEMRIIRDTLTMVGITISGINADDKTKTPATGTEEEK